MGNDQFAKEVLNHTGGKQGVRTLADAIGMPDATDKAYITKLILRYEKRYPGLIKSAVDQAKEETHTKINEFAIIDKHSSRRYLFELPEELIANIEKAYPTMFREKKHFAWFCKNFKGLMIAERY